MMLSINRTALLAFMWAAFLSSAWPQNAPSTRLTKDSAQQWRADLRYMASEMQIRHKDLFHAMPRARFESAVKSLDRRIPSLSRNQMIVEMMRLVAMVGDGHSNIYPTRDTKIGFHSLPIKLYPFSDGMFVRSADKEHADMVGSRVTAIGGVAVEKAVSRLRGLIGHDNEMGVRYFAPILLTMPEVLHAVGLSPSENLAIITIEKSGEKRAVQLRPAGPVEILPADTDLTWLRKDGWADMRDAAGPDPLWLSQPKNIFWYEDIPDSKTVYAQINQVGNKDNESLEDFSKRLMTHVESTGAEKLIIDMRLDRGGNGTLLRPLELALIKSRVDQPGKLFFLIGRSTWSASQFFLDWAEKYTNAVFVGEPSGSKGNVYGDSRKITLPNSGITVRVSVYYWQDWEPWDTRDWTAPHVTAELSSADYSAGRDPAFEAAINYTNRKPLSAVMNDAVKEGGGERAVNEFRKFKSDPSNKYADTEEPLLVAGQWLLNEKKPQQALLLFQLDKEEHPNSFRGYHAAGAAYLEIGDKTNATKNLRMAFQLSPKNYDVAELLKVATRR